MSLREKINDLMDFTPSCDGPLPGMTRGGDYLLKSDVLRVIASENAAGDALTRQFNAAEELARRVMALKTERDDLRTQFAAAQAALEMLLECIDRPPKRNCSCHISPPCNDCVDYSHLREALELADAAIATDQSAAGSEGA